jgi:hypothetical protein
MTCRLYVCWIHSGKQKQNIYSCLLDGPNHIINYIYRASTSDDFANRILISIVAVGHVGVYGKPCLIRNFFSDK